MWEKSATHERVHQLVSKLCEEMVSLPEEKAVSMFLDSILISEIVEAIMELVAFASEDETGNDVFMWAPRNRHEKVFNLIYSLSEQQRRHSGL